MEKLKGGNVLIDLTDITLSIGSQTSIADAEVLNHFKELYPLVRSGSPKNLVFLKVYNGSETIIVPCEHVISGYNLKIRGNVQIDAKTHYGLLVEITYSVGEYDAISITSCKYTYTKDLSVAGDLAITGDASVGDDVTITGDASVGGGVTITGGASVGSDLAVVGDVTGGSIIENMSGYLASVSSELSTWTSEINYVGAVKNGNKLTLAISIKLTKTADTAINSPDVVWFTLPNEIMSKLYPVAISGYDILDQKIIPFFSTLNDYVSIPIKARKEQGYVKVSIKGDNLVQDTAYVGRYEVTFLLNDSLVSE